MSTSMRQAIITCIPKGKKDRKLIKNWRPISLLTVIYKLASTVIAERLKPYLNNIVSEPQSCFIHGRCIGDSTRLIYDYCFTLKNTLSQDCLCKSTLRNRFTRYLGSFYIMF